MVYDYRIDIWIVFYWTPATIPVKIPSNTTHDPAIKYDEMSLRNAKLSQLEKICCGNRDFFLKPAGILLLNDHKT